MPPIRPIQLSALKTLDPLHQEVEHGKHHDRQVDVQQVEHGALLASSHTSPVNSAIQTETISFSHVLRRTTPVGRRPNRRWKVLTSISVRGPKKPVAARCEPMRALSRY